MNSQETTAKISKIINKLKKQGRQISIDNIVVSSLMYPGGTLNDNEVKEYLKEYISIGFCQPKFYKASSWNKAKVLMNELVNKGYAIPFDYGKGKGKYTTTDKFKQFNSYTLSDLHKTF